MSNARNLAQAAAVPTALRNKLINGCFDIWQRGTSFDGTFSRGTYYGPDRWQVYRNGGAAGSTFSRTLYYGPDSVYALRMQRNSADTGTGALNLATSLESIDVYNLRGKQVTLSFRGLTGANFSGANLIAAVYWGTGTDGSLAAGFTNSLILASQNVSPNNGVQGQYSLTCTVPVAASQLGVLFYYIPTGTAGANDFAEITNVQLELGNVANHFERRPTALELMMCQRYYEAGNYIWRGWVNSGGYYGSSCPMVMKRVSPSITTASNAAAGFPATNSSINGVGPNWFDIYRVANGNGGGSFADNWTASAEL